VPLPARLFDESGDGEEAPPSAVGESSGALPITGPQDVGGVDERQARLVKHLESTIRSLETTLEEERRTTEGARAGVEEMREQVIAARVELDIVRDEVRAAQYEADELKELQAALQHRSRSLAVAVMGFVEILDDVIEAGRRSPDDGMRERADRLGDGVSRLLALFGLTEICGVGVPVDDAQHEVVRRVAPNGHGRGAVVDVVQRGFAYHGQTVRRAQVVAAE
jgi:molecular chaperone GrpE (heat shock protein)